MQLFRLERVVCGGDMLEISIHGVFHFPYQEGQSSRDGGIWFERTPGCRAVHHARVVLSEHCGLT